MDHQQLYWSSNLRFLRKRQGISQQQLANILQLSRGKIHAQESGKTKNPRLEDMVHIARYFGIPLHLFATENLSAYDETTLVELLLKQHDIHGQKIRVLPITVDHDNEEYREFVPVQAQAGYRSGYNNPEFITSLPKFSLPGLPREKTIRMFPISGDSMLPIPSGSHVIAQYVDDWTSIKNNSACILVLGGTGQDIVFKMVENNIKTMGSLTLHSLNPIYNSYKVDISEVLEIWSFVGYISKELPL
ncbi:DNA-binding protein [Chitinophaga caeni]|uniref:DNA-binding protein n=1 Tax=Chitinophaga caeni TaxID=2029983 RepID=A0A291QXV1_9BACT|nr:helix-turn-helix domain-containing protein [Chitinophaga caeni]ATL48693.1 DNA-binding protein [Chitinophaga caeni]